MKAKYLGNGAGNWKGVDLTPGLVFDVPPHLEDMVRANANFQVIEAAPKRGRPAQVRDDNAA